VQSFIRHVGFYWHFIKDFSKTTKPLTLLLTKDTPFIFPNECLKAFYRIKEVVINAAIIQPPDWSFPLEIMCELVITQLGWF